MGLESFKEVVARAHSTHDRSVQLYLDNSIMLPEEASPEAQKAERRSDSYLLRSALLRAAERACLEMPLSPGSDEALEAFDEASRVADAIVYAYAGLPFSMEERVNLTPEEVRHKLALRVPPHVRDLVSHVKKHGKLGVLQEDLSAAVGDYVKSRFKSLEADHLLLQALTQVEIVAYIDEMVWKNVLTGTSKLEDAAPASVAGAVWRVSRLIFGAWAVGVGIAASPLLVPALPTGGMLMTGIGLALLATLALSVLGALGVAGILRDRPRKRKRLQGLLDMIDRMNAFYLEFGGPGPFSLARFRAQVNAMAETGVVWPSGLWVLLDDMDARGVTSF